MAEKFGLIDDIDDSPVSCGNDQIPKFELQTLNKLRLSISSNPIIMIVRT